jgi:hypothetical protein
MGSSPKLGLPFLGAKDNFKFTLHYGDGYGTQVKGGPKEGTFDTGNSELKTIGVFGSNGGIQHFWSERFCSNLVYSYANSDNPAFLSGDTYDNTQYVAVDLIWPPINRSLSASNISGGNERTRTARPRPPIGSFFPPGLISEAAAVISWQRVLRSAMPVTPSQSI